MRSYLLALALTLVGTGFAMQSTPAEARDYAFCLQGRDTSAGVGDCRFATYQQCQATASGTYAACYANPYVTSYDDEPVYQPRRRTQRSYY